MGNNLLGRIQRWSRILASYFDFKIKRLFLFPKSKSYSRFVIVCNGRTGSNMLISYLNSHPEIHCFNEVFHVHAPILGFPYERLVSRTSLIKKRKEDPTNFLKEQVYCTYPFYVKSVGFKLIYWHAKYNDWNPKLLNDLKRDFELKIIHLTRRNKLELVISKKTALNTKKWVAKREQDTHQNLSLSFQAEDLKKNILSNIALEKEFDNFFQTSPKINVCYEDIIANPESELGRILEFLQVSPRKNLFAQTVKQIPQKKKEILPNYEELKHYFLNTEFEAFFDE